MTAELAMAGSDWHRQPTHRSPERNGRSKFTLPSCNESAPSPPAGASNDYRVRGCRSASGGSGCALNRPTGSPVKGSFARVSPNWLSYGCPTTNFLDPRNRHRHHLSATLLDGRAGNGWARLLRCARDRSGGGFPNAGYEPHPSCGDCPLTARSRPKRAAKISRKIVAGQQ